MMANYIQLNATLTQQDRPEDFMRKYVYAFILTLILLAGLFPANIKSAPGQKTIPNGRTLYLPTILLEPNRFICTAVNQIPVSECMALEQLFWATNDIRSGGNGWEVSVGWFQNVFPCAWYGIGCTVSGRYVNRITLADNNLSGAVPSVLVDLPNLIELSLAQNRLTGLPPQIGDLNTLRSIQLYGNQLNSLPPEIGKLSNLEFLDVGSNMLTTLPSEIGNLSRLDELKLSSTPLTALPESIGQLSFLTLLQINETKLSTLPSTIGQLSSLTVLVADHSQLTTLPPEFGNLTRLQSVALHANQLTTLPAQFGQLQALQSLELAENYLFTLPHEFINLNGLTYLDVGKNCLINLSDGELIAFLDAKDPDWRQSQRTDCK